MLEIEIKIFEKNLFAICEYANYILENETN